MTAPEEWVTTVSPPQPFRQYAGWISQVIITDREEEKEEKGGEDRRGGVVSELGLYVDFLHGLLLTGTSPHGEVERLAQSP